MIGFISKSQIPPPQVADSDSIWEYLIFHLPRGVQNKMPVTKCMQ